MNEYCEKKRLEYLEQLLATRSPPSSETSYISHHFINNQDEVDEDVDKSNDVKVSSHLQEVSSTIMGSYQNTVTFILLFVEGNI